MQILLKQEGKGDGFKKHRDAKEERMHEKSSEV